jgi:hypothetical protein
MVFTEDHAPLYPEMINDWKLATERDSISDDKFECIRWNSKIITRDGHHFVRVKVGVPFRVYGPCQRFCQGDFICRSLIDKSHVWVIKEEEFKQKYKLI